MVIDTHAPQFQVGPRVYDAQVIVADCERFMAGKGPLPSAQRIMELARWYCELANYTDQLRSKYDDLTLIMNEAYREVLVLKKDIVKMIGKDGGQDA